MVNGAYQWWMVKIDGQLMVKIDGEFDGARWCWIDGELKGVIDLVNRDCRFIDAGSLDLVNHCRTWGHAPHSIHVNEPTNNSSLNGQQLVNEWVRTFDWKKLWSMMVYKQLIMVHWWLVVRYWWNWWSPVMMITILVNHQFIIDGVIWWLLVVAGD